MQLGTPISMPTTWTPFIGQLYFIYQSIGQIISFQMMPPLRSFDNLDGKERGQKKTDDLRAMTTLGPHTLPTRVFTSFRIRTIVFRMILICDVVFVLVYTFKPKKCITYVCMNTCLGSTPLTETPAFRIFCGQNIRGRNVRAKMSVAEMSYIHTNMMMTIV